MSRAEIAPEGLGKRHVLLIVAHPDDECMFFLPTVRHLVSTRLCDIWVLCLSTGNAAPHFLGERRTTELKHSCSLMGIPWSHVRLVDDVRLQDGMENVWQRDVVAGHIEQAIEIFSLLRSDLDRVTIITFDGYGVSNHLNHRSVYHGVLYWHEQQKRKWQDRVGIDVTCRPSPQVGVYALHSVTLLVKYMGFVSWLVEPLVWWLWTRCLSRSSPRDSIVYRNVDFGRVWQSLACHRTQVTWWRVLFVLLSQYSTLNRLVPCQFKTGRPTESIFSFRSV